MSDHPEWGQASPRVRASFVDQVKDALEHLYDYAYLERHPLALTDAVPGSRPEETPGQRLRRELVELVNALNPAEVTTATINDFRQYKLLFLRYIEAKTVREASLALGISTRQAYRDLRRGRENTAALLWAGHRSAPTIGRDEAPLSSLRKEIGRLGSHSRPSDLRLLLQLAQKAVAPMARQKAISLISEVPRGVCDHFDGSDSGTAGVDCPTELRCSAVRTRQSTYGSAH